MKRLTSSRFVSKNSDFVKIFNSLSIVDKLLPLLILIVIIVGVLLSVYVPNSRNFMNGVQVVNVSVPVAVGLIVMMIPPLCKIQWEKLHKTLIVRSNVYQILLSLILNWVVCPFLMFGLAWATLPDKQAYREGIIMIGLARCIAMVLVWNKIVQGSDELCAILVIINSLLQIVLYAPYQIFFCYVITGQSASSGLGITYPVAAKSVAFFLGVPMAAGMALRFICLLTIGKSRYNDSVLPVVSPWALIGLLYTILVIFIERGHDFIRDIGSALRCCVPLIIYFALTWFGTFFLMRYLGGGSNAKYFKLRDSEDSSTSESEKLCGCEKFLNKNEVEIGESSKRKRTYWNTKYCSASYSTTMTQTFTASSNNFELSIAIAIAIYGNGSEQAIAATFGPLLEVPVLLALCFVGQYFKMKFLWSDVDYNLFDDEI